MSTFRGFILPGTLLAVGFSVLFASVSPVLAEPTVVMAMGHAVGQPFDTLVVPLTLHAVDEPPLVAGLDLIVVWDIDLANLEEVRLTEMTQNWSLAANVTPGKVAISMAVITPASATPAGLPMLDFVFTLREVAAQTSLALSGTRVFDLNQRFVEHLTVDGSLEVGVVVIGRSTPGSLKRMYAPSRR